LGWVYYHNDDKRHEDYVEISYFIKLKYAD